MGATPSAAPGHANPSAAGPVIEAADEGMVRAPDQAGQHLPSPAKVRAGEAKLPKTLKPIKTKPQLDGVDTGFNRASPFDAKIAKALGRDPDTGEGVDLAGGEEFGTPRTTPKTKQAPAAGLAVGPERGPDGKFLPRAASEEGTEEPPSGEDLSPLEAPEPPEGTEEEGAPQTYEEAVDAHKKVTQQYKSLQGMFKPLQANLTDMAHHQREAAKSATGWQAAATSAQKQIGELKAKLAQYEGGGSPNPAAAGGRVQADPTRSPEGQNLSPDAVLRSINWNEYEHMKKQGDDVAALWLTQKIIGITESARKKDIDSLREQFESFASPIREQQETSQQRQQIATASSEVFNSVAEITDPETGEPRFPELYDTKAAEGVGEAWLKLGLPPEFLLSPAGVVQAILNYRYFHGETALPTEADPGAEGQDEEDQDEEQPAPVADRSHLNSRAVRSLAGARSTAPLPSSSQASRDPASIIKQSMRATNEADSVFGFPTRRSARR